MNNKNSFVVCSMLLLANEIMEREKDAEAGE